MFVVEKKRLLNSLHFYNQVIWALSLKSTKKMSQSTAGGIDLNVHVGFSFYKVV